jgi:hypothetical protein
MQTKLLKPQVQLIRQESDAGIVEKVRSALAFASFGLALDVLITSVSAGLDSYSPHPFFTAVKSVTE